MEQTPIEILETLPDELRSQAAEVYWDAFSQKLHALVPGKEKAVALLARLFNPAQAIIAVKQGRCLGIAGLHYRGHTFVDTPYEIFREELGWLRGFFGARLFHAFEPKPAENELRIECLAVTPEARGQGIGTRLLGAVYAAAKDKGFNKVRLEVVDTNPDARRLYLREGFVIIKRDRIPLVRYFAGFSAQDIMVKQLIGDR